MCVLLFGLLLFQPLSFFTSIILKQLVSILVYSNPPLIEVMYIIYHFIVLVIVIKNQHYCSQDKPISAQSLAGDAKGLDA